MEEKDSKLFKFFASWGYRVFDEKVLQSPLVEALFDTCPGLGNLVNKTKENFGGSINSNSVIELKQIAELFHNDIEKATICYGLVIIITKKYVDNFDQYLKDREHKDEMISSLITQMRDCIESAEKEMQSSIKISDSDIEEVIRIFLKIFDIKNVQDPENLAKIVNNYGKRLIALESSSTSTTSKKEYDDKEAYKKLWDTQMFLDDKKVPSDQVVTLGDMFYKGTYTWHSKGKPNKIVELDDMLKEFLNLNEPKSLDYNDMMLLLGEPAAGKSSLITYLLNEKLYEDLNIKVFPFRKFKKEFKISLSEKIDVFCDRMLELLDIDLESDQNQVIIFDGLDEINLSSKQTNYKDEDNIYTSFINYLNTKLQNRNNVKIIVTTRFHRVNEEKLDFYYAKINKLSLGEINEFIAKYNEKYNKQHEEYINLPEKIENVIGNPYILYMVLTANIKIDENISLLRIYNELFSENNSSKHSIYYKINHDKMEHKEFVHFIRIAHKFSKQVSVWMFEHNSQGLSIDVESYKRIGAKLLSDTKKKILQDDIKTILSGLPFYKGQDTFELHFAHKTMYEYFLSLSIFDLLFELINNDDLDFSTENFNGKLRALCNILKHDLIDIKANYEINCFLKEMLSNGVLDRKISNHSNWKNLLDNFLEFEAIGYLIDENSKKIKSNILILQNNFVISNIINIIVMYNREFFKDYKLDIYKKIQLLCFIQRNRLSFLNLPYVDLEMNSQLNEDIEQIIKKNAQTDNDFLLDRDFLDSVFKLGLSRTMLPFSDLNSAILNGMNLSGADLEGIILTGAYLINANFERADLLLAYLEGAHLERANFKRANLVGAHLEGAHLVEAHLEGAKLKGANLKGADLKGAYLEGSYLSESMIDIRYKSMIEKQFVIDFDKIRWV